MLAAAVVTVPWWGRGLWHAVVAGTMQATNVRAVAGLRQISAAQATFKRDDPSGTFGSLEQLDAAGVLSKAALPDGSFFIVRTTLATPAVSWWGVAAPFGAIGPFQAFYTNETGQLWTLTLLADEKGFSIPLPSDFGDTSAPPPGATLYTGP